jgi:O-antigen/teichoic acid export membrane protein
VRCWGFFRSPGRLADGPRAVSARILALAVSQTGPYSKAKISRGVAWIGLASTLVAGLDLAAQVILLHLFITPAEYGIAALAVAFFPVLDHATDLGLSSALVQRDDHTPEKISTVFWLNLGMSFVLCGGLLLVAPLYARWMGHPVVGSMLMVYGGKLIFQNVYFIPAAQLRRELRFRELSILRIIANVAEFAGKVGFGALGFSVWAFTLGPLMRVLVTGVGVQILRPWRPSFIIRPKEAWEYLRFGFTTSASQIVFYFYTMVDYPIVNKLFGAHALGLYKAAYELVLEPVRIIAGVTVDVAFPTFSRLKRDRARLVEQFITFTVQNLVAVLPFVALVFVAAEDALAVAWGPDFKTAAWTARILCFVAVLRSLSYVVPPLLDGMGVPSRTLLYTVTAAVTLTGLFLLSGVLLGPTLGYSSVALAWAVGYPLAFAVLVWIALHRLELRARDYLRRPARVVACVLAAMPPGFLVEYATRGLPATPQLAIIGVVMVVTMGLLLDRFTGINLRNMIAALRGKRD